MDTQKRVVRREKLIERLITRFEIEQLRRLQFLFDND
jgi:hypothetical protein